MCHVSVIVAARAKTGPYFEIETSLIACAPFVATAAEAASGDHRDTSLGLKYDHRRWLEESMDQIRTCECISKNSLPVSLREARITGWQHAAAEEYGNWHRLEAPNNMNTRLRKSPRFEKHRTF